MIAILLTDEESINEKIILKSWAYLKNSKIKKIYFIGDKYLFSKIYKKTNTKEFEFIEVHLLKKNYYLYLDQMMNLAIKLFKEKKISFLINMPINKKKFLNKKFKGFTEFFSYKLDKKKNENMILYNEKFSVCPLTTHIELKDVNKSINKKLLENTVLNIHSFFSFFLKKKNMEIIVLGINPHASIDYFDTKDEKIIKPIVEKFLKKGFKIKGPVSADTAFRNLKRKIFIGMYHDQVLIPFKLINSFNGINITIGKKLIRLSPDHGPGYKKLKNKFIKHQSFINCINFIKKYKKNG